MGQVFSQAPEELTRDRLTRLGEGIGKVVYASEHWVVKRERTPTEVAALIVLWRILRTWAHNLPFGWGERLLRKPSSVIRFLRVITEAAMLIVPKSVWYTKRIAQVWRNYHFRDRRGEKLAREHLAETDLLPKTISFPPATVLVGGWPGWLTVSEATERVEATLDSKIEELARDGKPEEIERWLNHFLEFRQTGWRRGLFSTDAHLKNFGVIGGRIVLLDTGGLTNRWGDIDERLSKEVEIAEPHINLGLEHALAPWPDVARRFNERWKSTVNRDTIEDRWPDPPPR